MPDYFRHSEPVSPTGGLQGKGLLNLLGKPPMDKLTLVLRESVQNAWDARLDNRTPSMLVRYRVMTKSEAACLRKFLMESDGNSSDSGSDPLVELFRSGQPIPVLELCDFGTHGLGGEVDPVRYDSRFTKFFFDIGNQHFDGSTGGTYGFGRSSLYLVGRAHTIIADSLTSDGKRRLMACRLGESFTSGRGRSLTRHTGRHFWGVRGARDNPITPLTAGVAERLAHRLGLPERDERTTGTSILIPWPLVDEDTAADLIPQILYHNLWPKLVKRANGRVPMKFEVDAGKGRQNLDLGKAHDIYNSFAIALTLARSKSAPAMEIGPMKPDRVGGHVAIAPARNLAFPQPLDEDADPYDTFREGISHVALMRSSELVVRYQPIDTGATEPWVGVLVANDDPEVSSAFAGSEPPAHDDWIPKLLKGRQATIVRMTLKRLPEAVSELLGVKRTPTPVGAEIASLASAADHFASQFLAGTGSAAAVEGGESSGGGTPKPRPGLSTPEFVEFRTGRSGAIAVYRVNWKGTSGRALTAHAEIAIEGGALDTDEGIALPRILWWEDPDGSDSDGPKCVTTKTGEYRIAVAYGGDYAVHLEVSDEVAA